jgi:hypothetical protein
MDKVKDNRGGARAGAGRKPRYGEKTENLTLRVPKSHKGEIIKMVREYLKTLVVIKEYPDSNG